VQSQRRSRERGRVESRSERRAERESGGRRAGERVTETERRARESDEAHQQVGVLEKSRRIELSAKCEL
jgi:hypothetical protein